MIYLCIYSPVCSVWFRLVYSLFPGVSVHVSPALSCLDVIKDYYLSLRPRLRVLVPPSCVHGDRRPDLTVSGAHSPRFVLFVFWKVFICSCVCLSRGKEVAARHPARSPRQDGVGVRRGSSAGSPRVPRVHWPRALMPADRGRYIAGCLVPGLPLPQARRSREITPPDRRWLNARWPASDSMSAGSPLTQSPPDRRWLKPAGSPLTHARRIATDSSTPDWRWLMPAGRRYP